MQHRYVFLDRDGTLIEDRGYIGSPKDVVVLPGVIDGLRALATLGYRFMVITNQSAIGRGIYSQEEVVSVNAHLVSLLSSHGVTIEAVYYCPHAPDDQCNCRKPKPGLLYTAFARHNVLTSQSIMVGDRVTDVESGLAAGLRSVLVNLSLDTSISVDAHVACIRTLRDLPTLVLKRGWL